MSRLPVGSSARTRPGRVNQRPSNGYTLLLAAGELGSPVVHALGESHQRQGFARTAARAAHAGYVASRKGTSTFSRAVSEGKR